MHNNGKVVWQCFLKNLQHVVKLKMFKKHEQLETAKIQIHEIRNKCKRKDSDVIH